MCDYSKKYECGCRTMVVVDGLNYLRSEIEYCPKHAGAAAMFEALKFAKDLLEATVLWTNFVDEMISPALELAGGSDD